MKNNIIKIMIILLIFTLFYPLVNNYTYAAVANKSIYPHLYGVKLYSESFDEFRFWELNINVDDSKLLYNDIQEQYNKYAGSADQIDAAMPDHAMEVLVKFMQWLKGKTSEELAKENDEYYLKIGKLTLNAGLVYFRDRAQDSEADGSRDITRDERLSLALDIYGNPKINWDAADNKDQISKAIKNIINELETQYRKLEGAENIKTGSSGTDIDINDKFEKKANYTAKQREKYIQTYGVDNFNMGYSLNADKLRMLWANGVSLKDDSAKKVGYNATQIKTYVKVKGNNFSDLNDSVIREWYTVIIEGKHTAWSKSIVNGVLKGGWNKDLTNSERSKMTAAIQNYCSKDFTEKELNDAKAVLEEIYNDKSGSMFYKLTGMKVDEASDKIGEALEDEIDGTGAPLYQLPEKTGSENGDETTTDIDTIVDSADSFIDKGEEGKISEESIKSLSDSIYNILLIVGVVLAVIIGGILGIKFMVGSVEQQADVKKLLIPYIVGCVVIFGSFGIWKLVVTMLASI